MVVTYVVPTCQELCRTSPLVGSYQSTLKSPRSQIRSCLFKIFLVRRRVTNIQEKQHHSVNTSSLLGSTRKTSKVNLVDCQDTVVLPKMFGRRIEITLLFE